MFATSSVGVATNGAGSADSTEGIWSEDTQTIRDPFGPDRFQVADTVPAGPIQTDQAACDSSAEAEVSGN